MTDVWAFCWDYSKPSSNSNPNCMQVMRDYKLSQLNFIFININVQITRSKCNKVQSLSCHTHLKAKHGDAEPGKDERVGPDLNARHKLFSKACLQLLPTSLNTRVR